MLEKNILVRIVKMVPVRFFTVFFLFFHNISAHADTVRKNTCLFLKPPSLPPPLQRVFACMRVGDPVELVFLNHMSPVRSCDRAKNVNRVSRAGAGGTQPVAVRSAVAG